MVGYDPDFASNIKQLDHEIAAVGSGTATRLFCQPLDVVKIRFQLQVEPISSSHVSSKYKGLIQATRSIVAEEGVSSLWKGHVPAQCLSIVYGYVQFVSFEYYTKQCWHLFHLTRDHDQKPIHLVCGSLSGCTGTLAAQPFDVVRTRLIAQGEPKVYTSLTHSVKSIMKADGFRGFYRGLIPTMMQIMPYAGLQFYFNRVFNEVWVHGFKKGSFSSPSWSQSLICGALSGLGSKTIVYPLDVVKKRLQVTGFEEARKKFGQVRSYKGITDCVATVIKQEKIFGLYKGFYPSLIKATLASGLYFSFYEQFLQMLIKMHLK